MMIFDLLESKLGLHLIKEVSRAIAPILRQNRYCLARQMMIIDNLGTLELAHSNDDTPRIKVTDHKM
jgi:hypothetical protein